MFTTNYPEFFFILPCIKFKQKRINTNVILWLVMISSRFISWFRVYISLTLSSTQYITAHIYSIIFSNSISRSRKDSVHHSYITCTYIEDSEKSIKGTVSVPLNSNQNLKVQGAQVVCMSISFCLFYIPSNRLLFILLLPP